MSDAVQLRIALEDQANLLADHNRLLAENVSLRAQLDERAGTTAAEASAYHDELAALRAEREALK